MIISTAMGIQKSALVLVLLFAFISPSRPVQAASASKIFVMTSTYGVLTGTLAGLASLAFYGEPGDHTRNMAMGASLGLYAGIALGLYIVYAAPDKESEKNGAGNAPPSSRKGIDKDNPLGLNPDQSSVDLEKVVPTLVPSFTLGLHGQPMFGVSYVF